MNQLPWWDDDQAGDFPNASKNINFKSIGEGAWHVLSFYETPGLSLSNFISFSLWGNHLDLHSKHLVPANIINIIMAIVNIGLALGIK